MNALSTLFPVFFMIILGMIARIKGFISPEQKEEPIILSLMYYFQYLFSMFYLLLR